MSHLEGKQYKYKSYFYLLFLTYSLRHSHKSDKNHKHRDRATLDEATPKLTNRPSRSRSHSSDSAILPESLNKATQKLSEDNASSHLNSAPKRSTIEDQIGTYISLFYFDFCEIFFYSFFGKPFNFFSPFSYKPRHKRSNEY